MMVTERVGGVFDLSSSRVPDYSAQWAEYYRSVIWSEVEHINIFPLLQVFRDAEGGRDH